MITTRQAHDTLRAIVDEFGADHKYDPPIGTSCFYTVRDTQAEARQTLGSDRAGPVFQHAWGVLMSGEPVGPGCLIGQMMHRLGVDLATLALCDSKGAIQEVARRGLVDFEDERLEFALAGAQSVQDKGGTWGEALTVFEHALAVPS